MLIFGKSVGDWKKKADYAVDKADNEYAHLHEIRCESINDTQAAFAYMAALAADTKCSEFLYHATINLLPGERLKRAQWQKSIEQLEKALGLSGHYRVVFEHIKKNRQHYHIVWCRLAPGSTRAVNMGHDYRVHQKVAIALEKEFGLKPSRRKDRDAPSKKKQEINNRNNRIRVDPDIVKKEVTHIYKASQTGKEFMNNLTKTGYTLTRAKNDSLVLVDRQGGYHGLLRRLEGIDERDLQKKFPELAKAPLPSLNTVLRSRSPVSARSFKKIARIMIGGIKAASVSKALAAGAAPRASALAGKAQNPSSGSSRAQPVSLPRRGKLPTLIKQARKYFPKPQTKYYPLPIKRKRRSKDENILASEKMPFRRPEWESAELMAWAMENHRSDVLAEFGIFLALDVS